MTENERTLIWYLLILVFALLVSFYVIAVVAKQRDTLKEEAVKLNHAERIVIGL
jgi:hypothetical protein